MKKWNLLFCLFLSLLFFKSANAQLPALITGHVFSPGYGLIKLGDNKAKLYSQATNWHLADSSSIDTLGEYAFYNVTAGNYIVLAEANDGDYPLAIPTYYGDTTRWEQASIITALPNTTHTSNIVMKEDSILTGNATLSGTLTQGNGFDRAATPIPRVKIKLRPPPPDYITIAHTTTDGNGYYEFKNVSPGNYEVYVDVTGLPMANTYHLNTTPFDTIRNLDFVADSISIDTVAAIPTTIFQIASSNIKVAVYPNPYNGFTAIEFTVPSASLVQMDVYNLLGAKVTALVNEKKQAGVMKYNFNAADMGLKAGIYLLKLQIGNQISTIKMTQVG